MKGKSRALFIHAKNRAKERFGIDMNADVHREIVDIIQKNKAKFVQRQSNRVTIWDVDYRYYKLRVVYDKNRGQVVTFLNRDGYMNAWERLELEKLEKTPD